MFSVKLRLDVTKIADEITSEIEKEMKLREDIEGRESVDVDVAIDVAVSCSHSVIERYFYELNGEILD